MLHDEDEMYFTIFFSSDSERLWHNNNSVLGIVKRAQIVSFNIIYANLYDDALQP